MFETPILDVVTVLVIAASSMVDFSLTDSIAFRVLSAVGG